MEITGIRTLCHHIEPVSVRPYLCICLAVVDRIIPTPRHEAGKRLSISDYIPSLEEQEILIQELTLLVATSVVQNLEQINKAMADLFPMHLQHDHSDKVGMKTQQVREYI